MKVLFICKASTEIGFGHLIRSKTVAKTFIKEGGSGVEVDFILIGKTELSNLFSDYTGPYNVVNTENEINLEGIKYDFCFIDLLYLNKSTFDTLKNNCNKLVSLSPVFNYLSDVDILFHRTSNINSDSDLPPKVYSGLEYTVIQENCFKIGAGDYESNLNNNNIPIAISMGGGDAANKTLSIIKALRGCDVPVTFWVTLGEGYGHSYDALIKEIKGHTKHEIILARTNKSMWKILNNCSLAILLSGITAYEAVFAGLPSLIFYENNKQLELVNEIFKKKAAIDFGFFDESNLMKLKSFIEHIYNNRRQLFDMHLNTKELIAKDGSLAILETIKKIHEKR